jgi:hypothetical protein
MDDLFKDIEKSLDSGNYYAALFMILCIPDICLSIKIGKHLGDDYVNWFNNNMPSNYKGYITGKDCYAFRCAILHEGKSDVLNQRMKDVINKFEILSKKESSHLAYMEGNTYNGILQSTKLVINLNTFCKDLIEIAKKFIKENKLKVENLVEIKQEYNDGYIRIN